MTQHPEFSVTISSPALAFDRVEGRWGLTFAEPYLVIAAGDAERRHVPARIVATATNDAYAVEITTCIHDGAPAIDSLSVRRHDESAPPIGSDVLREIGFGGLLAEVVEQATWRVTRDADGLWSSHIPADRAPDDAAVLLLRRGRRPDNERLAAEVEQVAAAYRDAVDRGLRAPVEYVGTRLGMSRRTVQRRVQTAKDRGLIEGNER